MRKWLIAGGIGGVLVAALLLGSIVMPAFAHDTSARHDATITPEQAKAAALKDNPDATVTEVELENENGVLVYDVEMSNGMDVEVDAGTGVVLHTGVEDEVAALAGEATITPEQAKAAALKDNPDATVTEVELENENGVLVYDVEMSNGRDVEVDASTGVVLHTGDEDED